MIVVFYVGEIVSVLIKTFYMVGAVSLKLPDRSLYTIKNVIHYIKEKLINMILPIDKIYYWIF